MNASTDNQEKPDESVRTQYERLRQHAAEDALDGIPPFPRLPANLDDPVALNNWVAAWNAWANEEAVQRQHPWVRPIDARALSDIVKAERRLRADLSDVERQRELASARTALDALECRLQRGDPLFPAKRRLLVPILKPAFKYVPHAKWA